jgi:hypothetical protein
MSNALGVSENEFQLSVDETSATWKFLSADETETPILVTCCQQLIEIREVF